MNPHPNGHKLPSALHVLAPDLGDDAIGERIRCRYQCATCGWTIVSDSPALMRRMAREHHGILPLQVFRHVDDIPAAGSRQN